NPAGVAGRFRVGWFDAVLARFALGFAGPVDRLALTCVDRVEALAERAVVAAWSEPLAHEGRTEIARRARPGGRPHARPGGAARRIDGRVGAEIEALLGRRVDLESWSPTASGKRPRTV